jgi:two-component system OmpR family sensor kinase
VIAMVAGCLVALSALAVAAVAAWRRRAEAEQALQALHELRGPLSAIGLALALAERRGELTAAISRAVELELGRAARALQDLERAHLPASQPSPMGSRKRRRARLRPGKPWPGFAWSPTRRWEGVGEASAKGWGEEVDLAQLLADASGVWEACARGRGATLVTRWQGERAWVRGDRVRLAQLAGNLVANAIEHGGGAIRIEGRVVGPLARIEVSDQGPGLPATVERLISARRRRGVHGRGLAIAARIAAEHGGRVGAAPARQGARMVLELPLARRGGCVQLAPTRHRR